MNKDPLQTKRDIQAALASADLRPDTNMGQHFLIDGNLMRILVEGAEIAPTDSVLEVGGGTGGLSDLLADRAGWLVIVELHRQLARLLEERFAARAHVRVVCADVLSNKSTIAPVVLEAMSPEAMGPEAMDPEAMGQSQVSPDRHLLVANLPYNIATPLILNLLTSKPAVERFCFTIQKEVADRLLASAGCKAFGPASVAVQTVCHTRRLAVIPPSAFWPAPKVESMMLRLDRKPHPFDTGRRMLWFMGLVRAGFAHRRKTLRFNLARHLDTAGLAQASEIVDLTRRPEAVDLETWIALGKALAPPEDQP